MEQRQEKKRYRLWFLLLSLLILLPLCTVATYTWFSISAVPKVSDMEMTINSGVGLQIAWSAEAPEKDWKQQLDFTDQMPTDTLLTPVTWSNKHQCFYTTTIGDDGRNMQIDRPLSDERDANKKNGQYVAFTLYGRTDQHVDVSLAPAVDLGDGTKSAGTYLYGMPIWDAEEVAHRDGGHGSQYATRIGLRITKCGADGVWEDDGAFYVYEPNCDKHIDDTVGYVATPSADGTAGLVPDGQLIRQTTSVWEESDPVQRDVVIRQLGEFEDDTELFELNESETVRIDVYIWLEGMDVDCVNAIGQSARLFANLQFLSKPHSDSGLVPIE